MLLSLLLSWWLWLPSPTAQAIALDPRPAAEARQFTLSMPDASNIPTEKVTQFVQACLQVIRLIEQQEPLLQAAATDADATRIEQAIETAALAIIEKHGLTRQEYLQLLGLANTDPEFGERVAVQLQETVNE